MFNIVAAVVKTAEGGTVLESTELTGVDRHAEGALVELPLVLAVVVAGEDNLYGGGVAEGVLW